MPPPPPYPLPLVSTVDVIMTTSGDPEFSPVDMLCPIYDVFSRSVGQYGLPTECKLDTLIHGLSGVDIANGYPIDCTYHLEYKPFPEMTYTMNPPGPPDQRINVTAGDFAQSFRSGGSEEEVILQLNPTTSSAQSVVRNTNWPLTKIYHTVTTSGIGPEDIFQELASSPVKAMKAIPPTPAERKRILKFLDGMIKNANSYGATDIEMIFNPVSQMMNFSISMGLHESTHAFMPDSIIGTFSNPAVVIPVSFLQKVRDAILDSPNVVLEFGMVEDTSGVAHFRWITTYLNSGSPVFVFTCECPSAS